MKANELRIGNIISYKSIIDGKTQDVSVNIYHLADIGKTSPLFDIERAYAYSQIPLTEKWLLKFGFKNPMNHLFFYKSHGQVDFNVFSWETPVGQSNGVPAGEFYMIVNGVIVIINTVHQLQNLYFALTGAELELK